MKPFLAKAACQGGDESREQWLSAGENDVLHSGLLRLIYQLLYRGMCPFRFPRGVGSIAKPASEVAAGCSNEKARCSCENSFPLPARKGFGDAHLPPFRL